MTNSYLEYGQKIRLENTHRVDASSPIFCLSGARGSRNEGVITRDRNKEDPEKSKCYEWTVKKGIENDGSGAVHYGDRLVLLNGGAMYRWLSGARGSRNEQVITRDPLDDGREKRATYNWVFERAGEWTPGHSGKVGSGELVRLKLRDHERWLRGCGGESSEIVVARDYNDEILEKQGLFIWNVIVIEQK